MLTVQAHSESSRHYNRQVFSVQATLSTDTTRGAKFLPLLMFLEDCILKKVLFAHSLVAEMPICFAVQHVLKAWAHVPGRLCWGVCKVRCNFTSWTTSIQQSTRSLKVVSMGAHPSPSNQVSFEKRCDQALPQRRLYCGAMGTGQDRYN